jgi:hypothetical protein
MAVITLKARDVGFRMRDAGWLARRLRWGGIGGLSLGLGLFRSGRFDRLTLGLGAA